MKRISSANKALYKGLTAFMFFLISAPAGISISAEMSPGTEECISCHTVVTPGIVGGWRKSRHSATSPAEALKKNSIERRVSAPRVMPELLSTVVGCAECHQLNGDKHKDSFEHNGYNVHVVVTPDDCSSCHPVERTQFDRNLMSHAHNNLFNNPLYRQMADSINGIQSFNGTDIALKAPDEKTSADSCLHCHGTKVTVNGSITRETAKGEMNFPVLSGWPNQGVGRINPDGGMGACTSCHTRHEFSLAMARKPDTCSQCHKGPDVPAFAVYSVSKHGNIYSAMSSDWNFEAVPWRIGRDFTAPTCAGCHVSLTVNEEGNIVAQRSHQMNDRLPWRIFGLIYAHPHPRSADVTGIKNKGGLPLPTELTGEPVVDFLIDTVEREQRRTLMQSNCLACHSRGWVEEHWARLENTIKTTNEMTLTSTKLMLAAWEKGIAKGPGRKDSLFDENMEKIWMEQWLFYGNSTRFASAMSGADYGVYANGRWKMSKNVQDLFDHFKTR
jgi:hydroxylamine dehydrogenase